MDIQKRNIALSKLAKIAEGIISEEIEIIDGARKIVELRFQAGLENDDDLLIFRGIDSDTDDYPIGDIRTKWSIDSLKKLDDEIKPYLDKIRPKVYDACKKIIKKTQETHSD